MKRILSIGLTALVIAGCSTEQPPENESPRVAETVQVQLSDDPALGDRVWVEAQSWDGRTLFASTVERGASVELDVSETSFMLTAVNPENPDARRFAWVANAPSTARDDNVARQALSQPIALDEQTTAQAFARVAARDLDSSDQEFVAQHSGAIEAYAAYLEGGATCTAKADATTSQITHDLSDQAEDLLAEQVAAIVESTDAFEIRLLRLQQLISSNVRSLNQWSDFSPIGLHGVVINRTLISAMTDQSFTTLTEEPIAADELDTIAATTLFVGWGNCRENAMTAAALAAQLPEVQQLAVVGLERSDGLGQHAVAIACTEPASVADLSRFDVFDGLVNSNKDDDNIFDADCHVIDPWLDEGTAKGNTEPLTADYVAERKWYTVLARKMVTLAEGSAAAVGETGECNCEPEVPLGCTPFDPDEPFDTEVPEVPAPFVPPPCDGPQLECPPRYVAEGVEMVLTENTDHCFRTTGFTGGNTQRATCAYETAEGESGRAQLQAEYEPDRSGRGEGCIVDEDGRSRTAPTNRFPSASTRAIVAYSGSDSDIENPDRRAFALALLAQAEALAAPCNRVTCPESFDDDGTLRLLDPQRAYATIPVVGQRPDGPLTSADCVYEPDQATFGMFWAQEAGEVVECPLMVSTGGRVDSTMLQAYVSFPAPDSDARRTIATTLFDQIAERALPCP